MTWGLPAFGTFFIILVIILGLFYFKKPTLFQIAGRNILNRKRSSALAIGGLLIGSTIISGSLILGDSMQYMVRTITVENLGELDISVSSFRYFDYDIYTAISSDEELGSITDRISPAIAVYGSVQSVNENTVIPKLRIIGFDENAKEFGDFKIKSGSEPILFDEPRNVPQVILNDVAGSDLDIAVGESVKIKLSRPEYSLDTIFLQDFNVSNRVEVELPVTHIVEREGFAQLQSQGRTNFLAGVYVHLDYLQQLLGIGNKINTIFISNVGDAESGIDKDDDVEKRLTAIMNEYIEASDIDIDIKKVGEHNYYRYSSKNIFFPGYHETFLSDVVAMDGIEGISPTMTYFANYLQTDSGKSTWYLTVTGLDPTTDSSYESLVDHETKLPINEELGYDEIILNNWTAEVLGVSPGDTVQMNYMVLNRLFVPQNFTADFKIKYVVDIEGSADDRYLMPDFPGIDLDRPMHDLDFNKLFYINESIVDEFTGAFEDAYWLRYKGTPKAFISLDRAQDLWSNDFGDLSTFKIYYDPSNTGVSFDADFKTRLEDTISGRIEFTDAGITINHVKRDSFDSASALAIFPQMFLGFGMIIIIAGIIFVINIMVTMVYNRRRELGILRSLGTKRKTVLSLLTLEGLFYALPASLIGTIMGLGVAFGLALGLNSIWNIIVESNTVPFHFTYESLFLSFISGFIIGLIAVFIASWRISKEPISALRTDSFSQLQPMLKKLSSKLAVIKKMFWGFILILIGLGMEMMIIFSPDLIPPSEIFMINLTWPVVFLLGLLLCLRILIPLKLSSKSQIVMNRMYIIFGLLMSIYVLGYSYVAFRDPSVPGLEMFFTAGLSLLFGLIILIIGLIFTVNIYTSGEIISSIKDAGDHSRSSTNRMLVVRNISRNKFRSISTIIMFSLIVFLIFALATNIWLQDAGREKAADQAGGGYDLFGESTIPVNFDLNNAGSRSKHGLNHDIFFEIDITPLKSVGHEVSKCSNMNLVYPPKIFGVDDKFVAENEFEFMRAKSDTSKPKEVWNELQGADNGDNSKEENYIIPIIGDYETLVWLYYGGIGSIFEITDDFGTVHELEVIGIINSPIFAGSFVMSEENFDRLFPSSGQLKSFLIRTESEPEEAKSTLEWEMRDLGMSIITVDEMTDESIQYVAAYMSLFQLYLYFGLVVGIAALGILSFKATQERKNEIGILKAIGFRNRRIFNSFIMENTIICTVGIIVGALSGIVLAFLSYPFWGLSKISFNFEMILFMFSVVFSIIIFTVLLTFYPAYRASKLSPTEALRNIE